MMLSAVRGFAALLVAASFTVASSQARSNPVIVADIATGQVLEANDATAAWHPASLTKLMTAFLVLSAIRNGKIEPGSPLVYTARAKAEPPSKMGLEIGQTVSVDDALKMLMIQSANDIALLLAEAVSGSVEAFVAEMNRTARQIGMANTTFMTPNGLPVRPGPDLQHTTAQDVAILVVSLLRAFPEQSELYKIEAIQFGTKLFRNRNGLIGRYPGADGMKTGYVCSSGFNLAATATRGGRRLVAVILGGRTPIERSEAAIDALDRGFRATRAIGRLGELPEIAGAFPTDLREEMCGEATAKVRAARTLDPLGHPWRVRLMSPIGLTPTIVRATAPPAIVRQKPATSGQKRARKPGLGQKTPKATATTVQPGSKAGDKLGLKTDPKTSAPKATPVPGAVYRNAAPTAGGPPRF